MLKMQLMSDLHLEFAPDFRAQNLGNADILMLNGDICVADYFNRGVDNSTAFKFFKFFSDASKNYKYVLYVPGNHENYHGKIRETKNTLNRVLSAFDNVHILNNDYLDIEDTRFIGTTLWTDCNKGSPLTVMNLQRYMNDFRLIKDVDRKFSPRESIKLHVEAKDFIKKAAKNHSKVVVMTHHAPSYGSVHSKYEGNDFNGGYYSNLDKLILNRPQIKLWTHGHMHDTFNYLIGDTNIVCNPKGYNNENPSFNPNLVLEC
jgi:predicted phosphohydrolase